MNTIFSKISHYLLLLLVINLVYQLVYVNRIESQSTYILVGAAVLFVTMRSYELLRDGLRFPPNEMYLYAVLLIIFLSFALQGFFLTPEVDRLGTNSRTYTFNLLIVNTLWLLAGGAISRYTCLLYTSPSPRDGLLSRMPSSA